MASSGKLQVFGAAYADIGEAMTDYTEMQALYEEGMGDYDAATVTKEMSGMLIVSNADASGRFKASAKGAVVGAVLGMAFAPAVLGMAALGAATGAAIGRVNKHLKRRDMKELGELLNPGESGIILVTESITDDTAAKLFPRALRKKSIEVEGDAEAIKVAVREAAGR
jgi:uncharacterized membrane protein